MDITSRKHNDELSVYADVPIVRRQSSRRLPKQKKSFVHTQNIRRSHVRHDFSRDANLQHSRRTSQEKNRTDRSQEMRQDAHTLERRRQTQIRFLHRQKNEALIAKKLQIRERDTQRRLVQRKDYTVQSKHTDLDVQTAALRVQKVHFAKEKHTQEQEQVQVHVDLLQKKEHAHSALQSQRVVMPQSDKGVHVTDRVYDDSLAIPVADQQSLKPALQKLRENYSVQDRVEVGVNQKPVVPALVDSREQKYNVPQKQNVTAVCPRMESHVAVPASKKRVLSESPAFFEGVRDDRSVPIFSEKKKDRSGSVKRFFSRLQISFLRQLFSWQDAHFRFVMVGFFGMTIFGSFLFFGHALATKDRVTASAESALDSLRQAASLARSGDLTQAHAFVGDARNLFGQAHKDIATINRFIVSLSRYVPGASRLASGDALVAASVHLSDGLSEMTALSEKLDLLYQSAKVEDLEEFSILDVAHVFFEHLESFTAAMQEAERHISRVDASDVPVAQRDQFIALTQFIAPLNNLLTETNALEPAIVDFLGGNGSRKYLFLFQNNQEMRASGGFIGSYGFLDMDRGHIREFKIDGIYNPDGQLTDKVVPPRPIQKISAAWSLHDSNWWPHFPTSAEKAIDFYARTGGPSVDGVIAVTPTMVEKMLALTGPIVLSQYDVTLTSDNFVELTQYKVEKDYDKTENRPKKILSDLMPALMGELKKDLSREKMVRLMHIISEGLEERHIMFYMRNAQIQDVIEQQHWGGRMLSTHDDYLSVVHTNINGFKTDGIIDEKITHNVSFADGGRIIDTVTVTRTHGGGDTGWEWWDAVNADYMRVYVPQGSRLLSATGHTREWHEPRLDYETLGFERDFDVEREENNVYVDPASGTRVYDDAGKTVFGNWVYVSPQESVTVTYTYELPWRYVTDTDAHGKFSSHGVLYQKQAGAENVTLESLFTLSPEMSMVSHVPLVEHTQESDTGYVYEGDLNSDYYRGIVFRIQ